MASKRHKRRRSCTSKIRHPTQTDAVKHLRRIGSRKHHTYKCPFCKGWHVGRPDKRKRQMIASRKQLDSWK